MNDQSKLEDFKAARRRLIDSFLPLLISGGAFFLLALNWGVVHGGMIFWITSMVLAAQILPFWLVFGRWTFTIRYLIVSSILGAFIFIISQIALAFSTAGGGQIVSMIFGFEIILALIYGLLVMFGFRIDRPTAGDSREGVAIEQRQSPGHQFSLANLFSITLITAVMIALVRTWDHDWQVELRIFKDEFFYAAIFCWVIFNIYSLLAALPKHFLLIWMVLAYVGGIPLLILFNSRSKSELMYTVTLCSLQSLALFSILRALGYRWRWIARA